jgi:hypothetical protein
MVIRAVVVFVADGSSRVFRRIGVGLRSRVLPRGDGGSSWHEQACLFRLLSIGMDNSVFNQLLLLGHYAQLARSTDQQLGQGNR